MGLITLACTLANSISDADANLNNNWTELETVLNGGVDAANLEDLAVATAKLANLAVTEAKLAGTPASLTDTSMAVSTLWSMAVNDYVELVARQTSGGNLNVLSVAAESPEFGMVRVG